MRKLLIAIVMSAGLSAVAQDQDLAFLYVSKFYNDSVYHPASNAVSAPSAILKNDFAGFNLARLLDEKKAGKQILGYSKKNNAIEAYYFPGVSHRRALVIGGVHGSELSSVDVARRLVAQLTKGATPYYPVIIIPSLFPDNAATAEACKQDRIVQNAGRYTDAEAIDPNRQLPPLGKPFYLTEGKDAYNRTIEKENSLLLQLVQAYAPDRIVNLHAIKDYSKAGIYADPRTDCKGAALGYASDSSLAITMAKYIEAKGGNVAGNRLKSVPTALYYLDPKPAAVGDKQERNLIGTNLRGKINGVSLGGWASTAVCDETNNYSRPAMRIVTIEFPGYKTFSEYKFADDRKWYNDLVTLYASSIQNYFLQAFFVEENHLQQEELAVR